MLAKHPKPGTSCPENEPLNFGQHATGAWFAQFDLIFLIFEHFIMLKAIIVNNIEFLIQLFHFELFIFFYTILYILDDFWVRFQDVFGLLHDLFIRDDKLLTIFTELDKSLISWEILNGFIHCKIVFYHLYFFENEELFYLIYFVNILVRTVKFYFIFLVSFCLFRQNGFFRRVFVNWTCWFLNFRNFLCFLWGAHSF